MDNRGRSSFNQILDTRIKESSNQYVVFFKIATNQHQNKFWDEINDLCHETLK
ncbi:hypothetical protein Hanom_Chr04g00289471 [Helianthus anomalus]